MTRREASLCTGIDPRLAPLAMVLTQDVILPLQFRSVTVIGAGNLPRQGPLLLAPTHRARWDALLLPHAAGRRVTGRDCRFMVTRDEMAGLQGWFLKRLGCFPVDQSRPSMASLRHAIDLLGEHQQVVLFPEGRIRRADEPIRIKQGLARLALMAHARGVPVQVVPVGIGYSRSRPAPRAAAALCFGEPLAVSGSGRSAVTGLSQQLSAAMAAAEQRARRHVGRPIASA
ncbi:lysophospholipid acyltransferase family protein [Synechococcus sp. RSCCF101]|uniref:lysophospholipid acyltransferase family protein n=1 Tax=Synechococcus sp. RSCCF101 TaxID=2511069 RepID=UPI00351A4782